MNKLDDRAAEYAALKETLWPQSSDAPAQAAAKAASMLRMYPPGAVPRAGSLRSDPVDVDSHWHFHDMHQLIYPFEKALEVEVATGRHLIPHQLAAWIPAGVVHRASLHNVPSGVVFFTREMISEPGHLIRVLTVSPLMREMIREALRWPLHGQDSPLRSSFLATMGALCGEWIEQEADLFLPTSTEPRLKRVLEFTNAHPAAKLAEVCTHAGMSERSLRRHLKADTGMSWEAYRQRSRLLTAVALLSESSLPMADIAERCGFESPSAFAKVFRAAVGEAPRDYRRRTKH